MIDPFKDIVDFHRKFGLEPMKKEALDNDLATFRFAFMSEELDEWATADADRDLHGCLDGMIDLVYVALGTLVMHGFTEAEMREAWRRVHEANMKKMRATSPGDSKRKTTYDVIKPRGWVPPDLSDLCR